MPMCKGKEQSNSILYPQPADRDLLYTVYWVLVVTRCAVSMCRGRNAAAGWYSGMQICGGYGNVVTRGPGQGWPLSLQTIILLS